MAVTHLVYPQGMKNILNGTIDLAADTIKVALMTASFSYSATDENFVNTYECGDADYTAGGVEIAISGTEITVSGNVITVDTSDAATQFTAAGSITASYAVIYDSTPATPKLISCVNFGASESSVAGEFKITWNASGLFTTEVNPV